MSEQGHRAQRALNGIFGSVGVAGLALLAACGAYGGPMGVTTGGAQDVGYARNAVAAGQIPPASAFVIEGLLSEHDIAVQHAPCEELLCFDAAVGVAPALDTGRDTAFMVVGFSTGMAPGALRRPALNLALVIDRSGSMAGAKMAAALAVVGLGVWFAVPRVLDRVAQIRREPLPPSGVAEAQPHQR